jgi:hypothetical protein
MRLSPLIDMRRRVSAPTTGIVLFSVVTILGTAAAAQRPQARADTASARPAYRNLDELVAHLPNAAPPDFNEPQAVALGAVQLSCFDRLQPRVPPRPVPRDSAARSDSGRVGSIAAGSPRGGRGAPRDSAPAAADNRGDNYFWVTSYALVPANNQVRAFWGCTDWHSAVSSTWAATYLTRHFPTYPLQDLAREKLADHLGASNIAGELAFFDSSARAMNPIPFSGQRPLFERPYGFAWLLKLQSELDTWPDDSAARKWSAHVTPLSHWMADSLGAYIAALPEPVRGGGQTNTALSLMLALDYATTSGNEPLRDQIIAGARRFYLSDRGCKTASEVIVSRPAGAGGGSGRGGQGSPGDRGGAGAPAAPDTGVVDLSAPAAVAAAAAAAQGGGPLGGGGDVVSPCLTEAALMSRVLAPPAFVSWLAAVLPPLESAAFAPLTEPAGGSRPVPAADRERISGVSFARAQAMERIAHALPMGDPRITALHRLSAMHAARGFELMDGEVRGMSWLPAFALLYVEARQGPSRLACACSIPASVYALPRDSAKTNEPEYASLDAFYKSLPQPAMSKLDISRAVALSAMPLACEDHPQPRPANPPYLWELRYSPVDSFEQKRAFYGCYDWHSAVNSAWALVKLLKMFPTMATTPAIRDELNRHFGASNIAGEVEFFNKAGTFEMPYGYAWFLRLQGELKSWNDPDAQRWAANLQPLATVMANRLVTYLNGLRQPVRTGVHPNTAMAMDNSLFYASHFDPQLDSAIHANAQRLFGRDVRCNTVAEPGRSDFESPCLYEAVIMGELMPRAGYLKWLDTFLPPLQAVEFRPVLKTLGLEFATSERASVASTSHLVGLSLVRGMLMGKLANLLPENDPRVPVLRRLAVIQGEKGLPQLGAVGYDGSHYYATWAITYFLSIPGMTVGAPQ